MTSHMFQDENVADQYCSVSDHTLLLFSASEAFFGALDPAFGECTKTALCLVLSKLQKTDVTYISGLLTNTCSSRLLVDYIVVCMVRGGSTADNELCVIELAG